MFQLQQLDQLTQINEELNEKIKGLVKDLELMSE
jgi:hypothetical protein